MALLEYFDYLQNVVQVLDHLLGMTSHNDRQVVAHPLENLIALQEEIEHRLKIPGQHFHREDLLELGQLKKLLENQLPL